MFNFYYLVTFSDWYPGNPSGGSGYNCMAVNKYDNLDNFTKTNIKMEMFPLYVTF